MQVIKYLGDTPSNAVWAETNVRQINSTIWLGQKIADYLPDVPAFFTIGNHGRLVPGKILNVGPKR